VVVIFERSDLAGKTTLARHYARALRYPIVKLRWDLVNEQAETIAYAKATVGILGAQEAYLILDRSFLSMWAYSKDRSYMEPLVRVAREIRGLRLVVLTADERTLRGRYEAAPDRFFRLDQVMAANAGFKELVRVLPPEIPTLHLDTGLLSPAECCQRIDALIGRQTGSYTAAPESAYRMQVIPIGEIPVTIERYVGADG
jgi:hypothetical protein